MNRDLDTIPTLVERLSALAGGDKSRLVKLLKNARIDKQRYEQFSDGISPTDLELERLATVFGSSPEYLGERLPPQARENLDGLLDYLKRFGGVHLFGKYSPQIASQSLRGEGRMDDRSFRDLIRNENLDDGVIDIDFGDADEFRDNQTLW